MTFAVFEIALVVSVAAAMAALWIIVRAAVRREWSTRTIITLGVAVAAMRVAVFFSGLFLYESPYGQVVGYMLLIANANFELAASATMTRRHPAPIGVTVILLIVTSRFLAWLLTRVGSGSRGRPASQSKT